VLAERFDIEADASDDDAPKLEILSDDDFEATVFEEAPSAPPVDTAVNTKMEQIEDQLSSGTSSEQVIAPPSLREEPDETMERAPVAPSPRDSGNWTVSALAAPPMPSGADDWVVTNIGAAVGLGEESNETQGGDDGTPIEGVIAAAPALPVVDGTFVAGEIDVPTPAPERNRDTPAVEFTAASAILGPSEPEPDTGSRTPPIERR
jgi:hypothetical protein